MQLANNPLLAEILTDLQDRAVRSWAGNIDVDNHFEQHGIYKAVTLIRHTIQAEAKELTRE